MAKTCKKDIVIVETAYDWETDENFAKKKPPFPETAVEQREFWQTLEKVVVEPPEDTGWEFSGGSPWLPAIAKRESFDQEHNALEAITAFDTHPTK